MKLSPTILTLFASVFLTGVSYGFITDRFMTGEWSEWSDWSGECSELCHPSSKVKETRTRSCSRKLRFCRGPRKQTRFCDEMTSYGCYPEANFSTSTCGTRVPRTAKPIDLKMELFESEVDNLGLTGFPYQMKIIRGHAPESELEYPWLVQFVVQDYVICAGSLITPYLVLTAAHCFDEDYDFTLYIGKYHTMGSYTEVNAQKLKIKKYTIHPDYDILTADNDFCVVELEKPANLNYFVNTVCLPEPEVEVTDKLMCFVAGWGVTMHGTLKYPKTLQEVYIPILDPSKCSDVYNKRKNYFTENMLCAGYLNAEADTCQGDSGAPLVCKQRSGQFFVAGLVSWGNGCAKKGFPGVYSKVSVAMQWIQTFVHKY